MPTGEVVVTTVVGLAADRAFDVFTGDIDRWWRRRPADPQGTVRFDGDRLVLVSSIGETVLATVAAWQPPDRLEMGWQGPNSQPGDTVVVEFEPETDRTRVTVRHRRPGLSPASVDSAVIGLWWGDMLQRLTGAHQPEGAASEG